MQYRTHQDIICALKTKPLFLASGILNRILKIISARKASELPMYGCYKTEIGTIYVYLSHDFVTDNYWEAHKWLQKRKIYDLGNQR